MKSSVEEIASKLLLCFTLSLLVVSLPSSGTNLFFALRVVQPFMPI